MKKRLLLSRLATALALTAALFLGCQQPDSPSPKSASSTDHGVFGSISGIILDSVTGTALPGVSVSISNGKDLVTTKSNANGMYFVKGLIPGAYVVSYKVDGYGEYQGTVTVDSQKYKTDDPFREYAAYQNDINIMNAWITAQSQTEHGFGSNPPTGSSWTYNEGDNTFTLQQGSNLTLTYNIDKAEYQITGTKLGDFAYDYAIAMSTVNLAPLTSGLEGVLQVYFARQPSANNANNDTLVSAVVKDGVELWARVETSPGVYENETFGPVVVGAGVTKNTGSFLFDKKLPANKKFALFANPFSQTSPAGITYYYAGSTQADNLQAGIFIGNFTTVHKVNVDGGKFPAIYAFDDKAIVVSHNIGSVNIVNRLAVDGSIALTFNKAIAADSFLAYIDRNANSVYNQDDGNGVWGAAEDVTLDATWNAAGTTVTLVARNVVGNPYDGYFPYGVEGLPLRFANAVSADGTSVATPDLTIYTEKALQLVGVRYLDSTGAEAPQVPGTIGELPFDGTLELTYDKTLVATAPTVELYKWTDGNADKLATSTELGAYVQGSPTVTVTGAVVAVKFGKLLNFKDTYAVRLPRVLSTRPNDALTDTYLGFRSNFALALSTTNLYRSTANVYHTEAVDDAIAYFPVKDNLSLTFATAIPAGVSPVVELYKASYISALTTPLDLLNKRTPTTTTVSTDRLTLTIDPSVNLELNQQYALAVKLVRDADGAVFFSSQSVDFFKENGVDTGINVTSKKLVDTQLLDNTEGASYYITFKTEEPLTLRTKDATAYPAIVTNIFKPTTNSVPLTTTFVATDNIVLEFNKSLNTPSASDVELYYWRDTNTIGVVETGELTKTPAVVSVVANVLTIDPTGTLAPGLKYAIKAVVTSVSDTADKLIHDSLSTLTTPTPLKHLSFQTATTLVDLGTPTGTDLLTNFAVNTKPTGQVYTGVDSAQTTVTFKWDLQKELYEETNYYKVYQKVPGATTWTLAGQFSEETWYNSLWASQLEAAVTLEDLDTTLAGTQSWLLKSGAVQYMVQAWTKTGLLKQSTAVSVSDTVGPEITSTTLNTAGNWGLLTYANNVSPTLDTYTNSTGSAVTLTYTIGNTNGELIDGVPASLTETITDANVTVAWAYVAAHNAITVTVTVPNAAVIRGNEGFTVSFTDSSGNVAVDDRTKTIPVNSETTRIVDIVP